MSNSADKSAPAKKILSVRPWHVAVGAPVGLGLIGLAMWLLPHAIVDENKYVSMVPSGPSTTMTTTEVDPVTGATTTSATTQTPAPSRSTDKAATENAYNSARVPIGVTMAALLAAAAAGAGVLMNHRTVQVARDNLQAASDKDDLDREQWREEQLSGRFQLAVEQLSDESAAVRVAGVHVMATLADIWPEQSETCVSVLSSYYALPTKKSPGEDVVRNKLLLEFMRRLGLLEEWAEQPVAWREASFTGAEVREDIHFTGFDGSFAEATFSGKRDLGLMESRVVLRDAMIDGQSHLWASSKHATVELSGLTIGAEGALTIKLSRSDPRGPLNVDLSRVRIEEGSRLVLALRSTTTLFAEEIYLGKGAVLQVVNEGSGTSAAVIFGKIQMSEQSQLLFPRGFVDANGSVIELAAGSSAAAETNIIGYPNKIKRSIK